MLLKNANIYRDDHAFHKGDLAVVNGRFTDDAAPGETLDLQDKYVIPGLIDIHFHGNSGADFSDGSYGGLLRIARYQLQNGVTSFSPASMTLPEEQIRAAFDTAIRLRDEKPDGAAVIRGITMEGPFFNPEKKGAQNAAYLKLPDFAFFSRLNQSADGLIKIACVAPELPGALGFIEKTSRFCTVSVAHTTATYEQARAGFAAGARHVTHLYNAMPPLAHREPGVIGAAADHPDVMAELITDGIHIHPSAVRVAFSLFGAARMILVSDSMMACGMANGAYMLGGQQVSVDGRKVTLSDGTIAGSATNLFDCMRTAVTFDIRPEDAIRAATLNPARAIGADKEVGSITTGKVADFVICNKDWSISAVYSGGKPVVLR